MMQPVRLFLFAVCMSVSCSRPVTKIVMPEFAGRTIERATLAVAVMKSVHPWAFTTTPLATDTTIHARLITDPYFEDMCFFFNRYSVFDSVSFVKFDTAATLQRRELPGITTGILLPCPGTILTFGNFRPEFVLFLDRAVFAAGGDSSLGVLTTPGSQSITGMGAEVSANFGMWDNRSGMAVYLGRATGKAAQDNLMQFTASSDLYTAAKRNFVKDLVMNSPFRVREP